MPAPSVPASRNPALAESRSRLPGLFSLPGIGAVGAVTLALTLAAWQFVNTSEMRRAEAQFDARVQAVVASITGRMAAYEQVLRGGVGLFDASQSVQRDEWHAYVQALRVADNYPGILGIGYGPLIPARERDGYIQGMRADGLADYRIWPEGERSEYAPVMYLERFEGPNPRVFGYDMMSEPKRSAAMRRAAESGTAALTGPVKLAAGADNQPIGLLMYLPVYRHGLFLAEGSGGRAAPRGFVYATFRLPTLMQAILGDYKRDFALALRDGDSASDASVMFESGDLAAETPFTQAQDIHLYGRTWTLHVATLPGFQAGIGHWKSRAVLVAGSALSLMLMALMWAARDTRGAALRLAGDMTAALRASEAKYRAIVEDQTELVCRFRPGGLLTFANDAYCRYFGTAPAEIPGTPFLASLPEADRAAVMAPIHALTAANPTATTEHRTARPGREARWHQWTKRALYDGDGKLLEYQAVGRDITEQKRAQEALRDSRALLRAVIDAVPATINVKDCDGRYVLVNAALANYHRRAVEDFPEKYPVDFYPESYAARIRARDAEIIATGAPTGLYELDYSDPDGRESTWLATAVPLRDDIGAVKYVVCVGLDITQRKRAEEDLRESRALLRAVIDAVPATIRVKDRDLRYVLVNRALANYHELPVEAFPGKEPADFHEASYAAEVQARDARVIATGEPIGLYETDYVERDGRVTTWIATSVPLRDDNGAVKYVVGVSLDITPRKEAERALAASERNFRELIEAQTELVTRFRPDTAMTFVNPAYCRYHERPPEALLGTRWIEQVYADDRPAVEQFLASLTPENPSGACDHRVVLASGEVRWQQWSDTARFDAGGRPVEYQSVGRDVTARKLAEQKLRESERRMRHLVESAGVVPYTWDIEAKRYGYIGPQVERLFGHSPEQWIDTAKWLQILHPDDRQRVECKLQEFLRRPADGSMEYRMLRPDGSVVWVRDIIQIETDENGRRVGYGTVVDVTDSKQREGQLLQAQKMEAVGQLTSGIAHDFNNLLMIVTVNLDMLLPRLDPKDTLARELAEGALAAGVDGGELTRQLLTYARKQPMQAMPIDLNTLVTRSVGLLRRMLGRIVDIETELAEDLWPIESDPAQLEAALTNLAINARDAMPMGGRLTIATANRHVEARGAAADGEFKPGDYVVLTVADTGSGIPPDIIGRVFEPFFTTKAVGKGSGLGLSMIYGFAKQSDGHVEIESEVDRGTTVRLYLPRSTRAPERAPAVRRSEPSAAAGELILVVEDNDTVRKSVVRQLQKLGYCTLEAEDGPEALAALEREPRIDLLFSDVVMPGGMSGRQLAAAVRRRRPDMKILLTSGFPDKAGDARAGDRKESVLGKPYRQRDLALKLREILQTETV
jgi:PAS domain S-box-containing protein